jgi:hypothetical protein
MPSDAPIHDIIRRLVGEEHTLRAEHAARVGDPATQLQRLHVLEAQLDQCWDLLRRRRALRTAGADPETPSVRPSSQVQIYRQ